MKLFSLAFFSAAMCFGFQASATAYLRCSNGDFDKVTDTFFQINLYEDRVEFLPYEGFYSFDFSDVAYEDGTYSIINKTTTAYAEGDEFQVTVDAILALNSERTELNVALSTDKSAFQTYTMTCKEQISE